MQPPPALLFAARSDRPERELRRPVRIAGVGAAVAVGAASVVILVGNTHLSHAQDAARAGHWTKKDADSILILAFSGDRAYGQIDLVHVNVADHDFEDVSKGWEKYYWAPWRKFLGQP